MSARPARLRRLLLYTLLCLAALPAMASAPSFELLTLDGQQFAPSWTADGKNYGWQLPGIWPRTFCYAPNRAVLVQTADMPSHLVKMVTMKTRPPSFGAAQWANEKRLDAPSGSVKAFCMSRQSSVIADRFAGLLSAPDASRWIAGIRTCSLDFFDPNACPMVPKTFEGFCTGIREMMRRANETDSWSPNWKKHYPKAAIGHWDSLMLLWMRRHGRDRMADRMSGWLFGPHFYLSFYGGSCGFRSTAPENIDPGFQHW